MRLLAVWVAVTGLALAACEGGEDEPDGGLVHLDAAAPHDASAPNMTILVDAVFDGDTVRVRAGSALKAPDGQPLNAQHIRYLGVDAPEIAHPEKGQPNPECWGDEAAAFNQALIRESGSVITLEFDPAHDLRDVFGRLLAYVRLADGRMANEVLIRQGQARSYRDFPHRNLTRFNQLEAQARADGLGLWSGCP